VDAFDADVLIYAGRDNPAAGPILALYEDHGSDNRVELGFVGYAARVAPCGDWSENLTITWDNQPSPNFGCAVQTNIAAQVADPRDLLQPRDMDDSDSARRRTVFSHYEKGEITSADRASAIDEELLMFAEALRDTEQ